MLRLDPGDGRIATTRTLHGVGGRRRVQRRARPAALLRPAHGDRDGARRQPRRPADRGPDLPGRRRPDASRVGARTTASAATVRNGLNFTERGFGVRAALGCSDRGHSAASQMRPGEVDWERDLRRRGRRWFHCGGVFSALSETTAAGGTRGDGGGAPARHDRLVRPQLPAVALEGARRSRGRCRGQPASSSSRSTSLIGNEEDFSAGARLSRSEGIDDDLLELDAAAYEPPARAGVERRARPDARRAVTLRQAQDGDGQRLGRRLPHPVARSTSARRCRASRSSTASAAATRSPPA